MRRPTSYPLLPTPYFLLIIILLLAVGLRLYHLDAQSFWNDEGNSARIAERTLDLILEGAAGDIHPPGYYLLLHYWRALFGQSEFALRSLSVVAGVTLVAFTYLLGRRLFGETTGLTAAFLGALSPFAVYYSQETRMYALLAVLSAASTYSLLRLLQKPDFFRKTWPLAYVLTSAAGLYTHYAFSFVLLTHNLLFVLRWLLTGRRSSLRWHFAMAWLVTQGAILLLFLPWLSTALRQIGGWPSASRSYAPVPALLEALRTLAMGVTIGVREGTAALIGAGLLLLAGLWPQREGVTGDGRPIALPVAGATLYLVLPIILIFALDLYRPAYLKFLLVVLPPFHLLLAHGVETLARFTIRNSQFAIRFLLPVSCFLLLGVYLVATFLSLRNLYSDPAYARDDYRQIGADVAASVRPGDGIILNAPNQWEVFTYYYPDQDVHPAPYRPGPEGVEAFMTPLTEQYQRLFVLYWGDDESDPQRLIETWLAANAYKAGDRWYGRVRLATYAVAPLPEEPALVLDARFGESIRLSGYALGDAGFGPGDVLPVTLFWEAQAPIAERYKVTVQLLDGAGQLAAQIDTEPGDGLAPTTAWTPSQVLTDRYGLALPPDLSPGRYTLVVALYHIVSGERLPVVLNGESVGDHLSLGNVEVEPAR
ncbi:MAG: glycosyltransferase family 39 protein [Anaerolineae bacterium]